MNREIKFRAWHIKDGKIYFDVPYSRKWECLPVPSNPYYGKIKYLGIPSTNTAWEDDIFIMQYTGLKDRNGKEIYEGDILREEVEGESNGEPALEFNYFLVAYVKEYGSFCLLSKDEYENYQETGVEHFDTSMRETYGLDEAIALFICGNIFETPNKLK